MNIVEEIRKFVEEESKKPTAIYGYEPYLFHLIPVHDYAKQLAEKLEADVEVVEIASWLHDIGSIVYGRKDHHITGTELAEKKLKELKYPIQKIEKVKQCILNHRGSVNNLKTTKEEKIIADADSLSHFDNLAGLFRAAFIEGLDEQEAMVSVLKKLINSWNKLAFEDSKEIIKSKYEAAILLLK